MHIISILLFAITSSSDAIVVGLSYGAKNVKINVNSNLIISFISGIGTFISMLFGSIILEFIPEAYANIFGSCILILFGIYLLINSVKSTSANVLPDNQRDISLEYRRYGQILHDPDIIDINRSKLIEFSETITLGTVLCLNNIGLGIGASITGLNIYFTSIASLILSLVFIPMGQYIGEEIISKKLSNYAEVISAFIIIILGFYELFI